MQKNMVEELILLIKLLEVQNPNFDFEYVSGTDGTGVYVNIIGEIVMCRMTVGATGYIDFEAINDNAETLYFESAPSEITLDEVSDKLSKLLYFAGQTR
jgi:hypothetical protein